MNNILKLYLKIVASKVCIILLSFVIICTSTTHTPAQIASEDQQLSELEVGFYVFQDKIDGVIKQLVNREKISAKISDTVSGTIERRKFQGTKTSILNELSQEFNFEWFIYNNTIYVSDRSEATTRIVNLNTLSMKDVLAALKDADLSQDQFTINYLSNQKTFVVTGPPTYVALVEAIVGQLAQPEEKKATETGSVTIYRGTARDDVRIDNKEKR